MIPSYRIRDDAKKWLKEDIPYWDVSSISLQNRNEVIANIVAKSDGMIAGIEIVRAIFDLCNVEITYCITEGSIVEKGDEVLRLKGKLTEILQAERTALNILAHLSGIATKTRRLVSKAREINPNVRVAATRKTIPGLREYEKWAVYLAGGDTHRMSLSDMVLLKENHLKGYTTITEALFTAASSTSFSCKIEVEVESPEAAKEAFESGIPDIVMLDNFSPELIGEVLPQLREINPNIMIEASGNITEESLEVYASTGVDILSMGSLTHTVKAMDLSLLIIN